VDFCDERVMEQSPSFAFSCAAGLQVRLFDRGWKGSAPEYISCLWVDWLLQCQIIDVPARQGELIWDEGMPGGYVGDMYPQPPVEV